MIYKFIDNNGSEISVNSLESLQALVDSDTINESTKVKAGLRGKWTIALEIEGLIFNTKDEVQNISEPEEDIKSFITQTENSSEKDEIEEIKEKVLTKKKEEKIDEEETKVAQEVSEYENNESSNNTSDYYTEKFENNDNVDELMAPSLPEAVKICFKKYFDFKGRASRSEYWYFILFIFLGYGAGFLLGLITPALFWLLGIFFIVIIIPAIAATTRRLHDINKSGWFQALPIPPGIVETIFATSRNETGEIIFLIIGLAIYIYLLVLYCTAGDSKPNRFGKNPLK